MNMNDPRPAIVGHMATLSDLTRCRILLLLERRELTVSELCDVVQLPQSTTSRHLKALSDEGWIASHREGTSRKYILMPDELDPGTRKLWTLLREQLREETPAKEDRDRLRDVVARRRLRSKEFFSSSAGQWDRLRDELFGEGFFVDGLLGLLDPQWTVGDLGCGTGQVADALSRFVGRVVAVDGSRAMVDAARLRLEDRANVELHHAELEALPVADDALDAATLVLVLHHVSEPVRILAEAARVLRPGGRLVVVDMVPHERVEYQHRMGHVWLGFSDKTIERYFTEAGLAHTGFHRLPAKHGARGPALFAATARLAATRKNRIAPNDRLPAASAAGK